MSAVAIPLAQPPRHQALRGDRPSDHRGLRSTGRLGLVLRRREMPVKLDHTLPAGRPDQAVGVTSQSLDGRAWPAIHEILFAVWVVQGRASRRAVFGVKDLMSPAVKDILQQGQPLARRGPGGTRGTCARNRGAPYRRLCTERRGAGGDRGRAARGFRLGRRGGRFLEAPRRFHEGPLSRAVLSGAGRVLDAAVAQLSRNQANDFVEVIHVRHAARRPWVG